MFILLFIFTFYIAKVKPSPTYELKELLDALRTPDYHFCVCNSNIAKNGDLDSIPEKTLINIRNLKYDKLPDCICDDKTRKDKKNHRRIRKQITIKKFPVLQSSEFREIVPSLHDNMIKEYFGNLWSNWTDWSKCSVTCGEGRKIRWRHCLKFGKCKDNVETEMVEKRCALSPCRNKEV